MEDVNYGTLKNFNYVYTLKKNTKSFTITFFNGLELNNSIIYFSRSIKDIIFVLNFSFNYLKKETKPKCC